MRLANIIAVLVALWAEESDRRNSNINSHNNDVFPVPHGALCSTRARFTVSINKLLSEHYEIHLMAFSVCPFEADSKHRFISGRQQQRGNLSIPFSLWTLLVTIIKRCHYESFKNKKRKKLSMRGNYLPEHRCSFLAFYQNIILTSPLIGDSIDIMMDSYAHIDTNEHINIGLDF